MNRAADWTNLRHAESKAPAALGDTVTLSDGEKVVLVAFDRPHKPAASGYIYVRHANGHESRFYAGVGGLEFHPRPDRDPDQGERL